MARSQINARITKSLGVITGDIDAGYQDWFPKLNSDETYVPVGWFTQQSMINDAAADKFKQVYMANTSINYTLWGGIVGSIIFGLPLTFIILKNTIWK